MRHTIRPATLAALFLLVPSLAGCGQSGSSAPGASAEQPSPDPATAGETIFCPEVQRRIARANCDDLTQTAQLAKQGVAAFNVPPLSRGTTTTIQLAIGYAPPPASAEPPETMNASAEIDDPASAAANAADAADSASSGADNATDAPPPPPPPPPAARPEDVVEAQPGPTRSYSPIVGRYMRAELVGSGFTIKPGEPVSKEIFPDSQTTWEWEVTPLKAVDYTLSIKTAVEGVTEDGTRYPLRSTVRVEAVTVAVPWYYPIWDWLVGAPAWLKALAVLIGAITGVVTAWKALRAAFGSKDKDAPKEPKP